MDTLSDDELTRPIIGIENRTAQEVFDIMCDRMLALRKRVGEQDRIIEFVTRWSWRERNGGLTDAERLSAIKFHPAIKPALPTPKEPTS